jgi:hypothetical protein
MIMVLYNIFIVIIFLFKNNSRHNKLLVVQDLITMKIVNLNIY